MNVTERKKAEEAVRVSKEKHQLLSNSIDEGFCIIEMIFDDDGKPVDYRFLEVNASFEKQTGLHDAEGKLMRSLAPGHEEHWFEIYGKVALTGEPVRFVNEAKALNRWYDVFAFPVSEGEIRKVGILFNDITKHKKTEESLFLEKQTLKGIMENAGVMLAYLDANFNFVAVNSAYASGSGHFIEELIGKNHFELFPSQENQAIFEKVRDSGQAVSFFDRPFEFADQPERGVTYWDWMLSPVKDEAGQVQGLVLSLVETTPRVKAQRALLNSQLKLVRSEKKYRRLYETSQDGIMARDLEGRVIDCNKAYTNMLGYSKEELKNLSIKQLLPEKWHEQRDRIAKKVLEEGGSIVFEREYLRKDGSIFPASVRTWRLTDEAGKVIGVWSIVRDITESKKAEEALIRLNEELEERVQKRTEDVSRERQRLYSILEMLPAYVILLDKDYRIPFANKIFRERFGESRGRRCHEYLFMRDSPCENCETYKVLKTNNPHHWMWTGPDCRDYDIYDFPFVEADGSTLILEMGIDITDRKKAEASVLAERKRLFDVLETLPQMICLLTPDYHVAFANRSFRERFGESNGRHCYEYCFGRAEPCDFCETYNVLKTGKPQHWEVAGPEGSLLAVYAFPFTDVDGSPMILEMNIDITERKRAEKQISDASLYVRSLIEASLDPLVTISAEGKITDVNQATESVTGFSRERLIGSDFSDYFTETEEARKGYQKVFANGFVKDYPLAIRHKSGKITHVLYNATVYKNEKGEIQGVFAAARDITELKKAEEMARESARKLKDAERLATIGATAGMVGHDIRNPLQAIEGDVYLAKSDLALLPEGEGKENIKESLVNIEKSVGYINKIVQDLQDYAKPVKPKEQEMNLEELCETLFKDDIPEDINVCCQVEKEAKKIIADPALLARILNNLIGNAIQAMPQGGNLTIHACQDAGDVIITVQDTGVGIAENIKPKIFMPLFTTKSKGQGFGLAVVKRMTEALNGTVTFESEEGKGTKFILRLPQKK